VAQLAARLIPNQKVACLSHVVVKIFTTLGVESKQVLFFSLKKNFNGSTRLKKMIKSLLLKRIKSDKNHRHQMFAQY
jgi:hypothetical protein